MSAPREKPILMSAPMVRAIRADTKSQTRRVVKPQPDEHGLTREEQTWPNNWKWFDSGCRDHRCPYGQPGDRLWVRESGWERPERTPTMMREGADTWAPYYFDADYEFDATRENEFAEFKEWGFKRRPSIHMPRWASRILLEIVAVRVERLQDISEADADAEGVERLDSERDEHDFNICPQCGGTGLYDALGANYGVRPDTDCTLCDTHAKRYRYLWESINGPLSWALNPWVWVLEFKRVTP